MALLSLSSQSSAIEMEENETVENHRKPFDARSGNDVHYFCLYSMDHLFNHMASR